MKFKNDFVWGAATAAYQIEGAARTGGRGPSVWDAFCQRPGAVVNGDTGDIACDHYHRYQEDIELMRSLNIAAYRFSVSWSRVLPEGVGRPNLAGLDFYDRLIDGLLEAGIEPYATLFHWDFPQELYLRGGWLNRDSVEWFGEYASLLGERYGDRVKNWWTLNEPPCFLGLGHVTGTHAPGLKLDYRDFLVAAKHAMMAHGRSVQALRTTVEGPCAIGYVPISHVGIPVDESRENIEAARQFTFGTPSPDRSFWFARLYLDPVVLGEWPEECIRVLTPNGPKVSAEDLALMNQPIDRLGLNFYTAPYIRMAENGEPEIVQLPQGHPHSAFDWPMTPEGLYWSVRFHEERYGLPMMITENGLSCRDWVSEDGLVHDPQRIDYLSRHLKQLQRADAEGYQIDGFFHWSLLDNFEWAEGYRHRFGMVHVDYETQVRTPKDSAFWYRDLIAKNGFSRSEESGSRAVVHSYHQANVT
ncbi:MAG: beta-glucosidase [Fimbriimonadaceae bacterium]|nr:beta-glucosidase [Fimbriimonadaceae bacterium]